MCSQHELTMLVGIIGKPQLPTHPAPPSPGTRVMIRSGTGHYFAGKTGTVVSDHPKGGQMIRLDDTRTETRVASRFIERLPEGSPTCEDAEEKPFASEAEDSVASDAEEKAAEPASPTAVQTFCEPFSDYSAHPKRAGDSGAEVVASLTIPHI